eukprot:TRINITY_DN75281_c0_g1_i1.p1 TRINITY_DN75281_c0_g1~~TRINITY_DN75281_c0_g1_i1.p1  ORF type:complete len:499 (+),score=71.25 TRINITY_DN75281_c0_g1_i1:23-1498(+)
MPSTTTPGGYGDSSFTCAPACGASRRAEQRQLDSVDVNHGSGVAALQESAGRAAATVHVAAVEPLMPVEPPLPVKVTVKYISGQMQQFDCVTEDSVVSLMSKVRQRIQCGIFKAQLVHGASVLSEEHNKTLKELGIGDDACLQLILSKRSLIVTASRDKTARLWDGCSGEHLRSFEGHRQPVNFASMSQDGSMLVTASFDKSVKLWDISSAVCLQILAGHDAVVSSVCLSTDCALALTCTYKGTARFWDTVSGHCVHSLCAQYGTVSPNGDSILTWSKRERSADLWSASDAQSIGRFLVLGDSTGVDSACFFGDGSSVCLHLIDPHSTIAVYNVTDRQCTSFFRTLQQPLAGRLGDIRAVRCKFSSDGSFAVTGCGNRMEEKAFVWDVRTGECVHCLENSSMSLTDVAFSHDDNFIVTASLSSTVCVFETHSGKCVRTMHSTGHKVSLSSSLFLVAHQGAAKSVTLHDVSTGDGVAELTGHTDEIMSFGFH